MKFNAQRIICFQYDSIFESVGGIQYYLDDFLELSSEMYGSENILSLIPQRGRTRIAEPKYQIHWVRFPKNRVFQKFSNRFSLRFYVEALKQIKRFKPSLILNSHVALGPMTYFLHRRTAIPYMTLCYGIECWGKLSFPLNFSLRKSKRILSISKWTKDVLVENGFPETQISIVNPGLHSSFEREQKETLSHEKPLTLLTISRLDSRERYKGHEDILHALAGIRKTEPGLEIYYVIHGDGSDRERLRNLVQELNLGPFVKFNSQMTKREDLRSVYSAADVYVMPSHFGKFAGSWKGEGFGIVYAEAGAMGLPCIAYDCGGVTDIIKNGETGFLVPQGNRNELAQAILVLARNKSLREKMGQAARKRVLEKFSRDSIRKQLSAALG